MVALSIKTAEADELARSLSRLPGESMTEAVTVALRERLARVDSFLNEAGIELTPIDASHARLALRVRIIHGRGMGHGGVLNVGDVFPYALAQACGARLLFVGDDFGTTDVTPALDPASA